MTARRATAPFVKRTARAGRLARWARAAGVAAALGLLAPAVRAQSIADPAPASPAEFPPVGAISRLEDVSLTAVPASAPQLVASGPDRLAIGWAVESGAAEGVYVRRRAGLLWDTAPLKIDAGAGRAPRDLALAKGDADALHLGWTALRGGRRHLFLAALSPEGRAAEPIQVTPESTQADADYPILLARPGRGLWIVWQSGDRTDFTIEAAEWDARTGRVRALPPVSGASRSAVAPRALLSNPPLIAWNEIGDAGSLLHLHFFDFIRERWERSIMTDALFDPPAGGAGAGALVEDCYMPFSHWTEASGAGSVAKLLRVGGPASVEPIAIRPAMGADSTLDQVEPRLAGPDLVTLAARSHNRREQAIQLARVDWPTRETRVMIVSPEADRHATNPSHASKEDWSGAAWMDDAADGGSGRVGFAEVRWSAPAAPAPAPAASDLLPAATDPTPAP